MRTTISLDDRLGESVKRKAAERGMSVSAYIAEVLNDAVKRGLPRSDKPFHLVTVGGGGPMGEVDLDRPRSIIVAEDEAKFRKKT